MTNLQTNTYSRFSLLQICFQQNVNTVKAYMYLETVQHLLGSLVPSLLLLILITSLTILFLQATENSHQHQLAQTHTVMHVQCYISIERHFL